MTSFKCKSCGGTLEINNDYASATCEYCGNQVVLTDEMQEYAKKLKEENEQNQQKEQRKKWAEQNDKLMEEAEKNKRAYIFKNSALSPILIIFAVITFFAGVNLIRCSEVFRGLFLLTSTAIAVVAWLMGMQIISEKRKGLHIFVSLISFAVFALYVYVYAISPNITGEKQTEQYTEIYSQDASFEWPVEGIALYLPDPNAKRGTILENTPELFRTNIKGISDVEFEQYVGACKASGFTIEVDRDFITGYSKSYSADYCAYNSDGYFLILNSSSSREITLVAPKETKVINSAELVMGDRLVMHNWTKGRILENSNSTLTIQAIDVTHAQYMSYCEELKNNGYGLDVDQGEDTFTGYANDGYSIKLCYVEGLSVMQITIESTEEMKEFTWPKKGAGDKLPKPKAKYGHVYYERDDAFAIAVVIESKEVYDDYVAKCKRKGFDRDFEQYDNYYNAKNKKGYEITIEYKGGNIMYISIDAP